MFGVLKMFKWIGGNKKNYKFFCKVKKLEKLKIKEPKIRESFFNHWHLDPLIDLKTVLILPALLVVLKKSKKNI